MFAGWGGNGVALQIMRAGWGGNGEPGLRGGAVMGCINIVRGGNGVQASTPCHSLPSTPG